MKSIAIHVEVPCSTFRQSRAREYGKTYSYPPHSTVYGLLLSLVGEMDAHRHCGVRLAIAMLSSPAKSKVLRNLHRFKNSKPTHQENWRPDYQELLTDIHFIVWVGSGDDKASPSLLERLEGAILHPELVNRWGVLFLGESDDLVDSIKLVEEDFSVRSRAWLMRDENGFITLPYWVDHFGIEGTRWLRYRLEAIPCKFPPELAWTTIQS